MSTKRIHWAVLLPAAALLADLAYCLIGNAVTGLDPSWINGITRAAGMGLVFGRDIVFPYGPLGYLLEGSTIADSGRLIFIARVCLALLYAGSIVYLCSALSPRRFAAAIGLTAFGTCAIVDATEVAGVIAAAAILLADRRSARQPYVGLAIGVLAGLAVLTKFTLGVQFAAGAGIVFALQVAREWRDAEPAKRGVYGLLAFGIAAVATMAAVLDGSLRPPFVCFALWALCMLFLIVGLGARDGSSRRLAFGIGASAVAFGLVLFGNSAEFIANSLQISLGYSSAMNVVPAAGASAELAMGSLVLLLLVLVAISQRSVLSHGALLGIVLFGWLNFKEGFVRQGTGHVVVFLIPMMLLFALLTTSAPNRRGVAFCLLGFAVCFFSLAAKVSDTTLISRLYSLPRFSAPFRDYAAVWSSSPGSEVRLAPDVFDDGSALRLASLPIDVQPWEASVAFANHLAWKPEPVFQSYSAYTPVLDGENAAALGLHDRRVLVNVVTLDGRNFMAESPLARRALVCGYRLDSQFGTRLAHAAGGDGYAVLAGASSGRCASLGVTHVGALAWDRAYPLPAAKRGVLTFLALDLPYSFEGRVVKTLFRGPEVTIDIRDRSGRVSTTRVLPENAVNAFLVSPNVTSTGEFVRLLSGDFDASVEFTLHTDLPWMFAGGSASVESVRYR